MTNDRSILGDIINFRGLVYAPLNENGVVFLFGKVAEDLNMYVEEIKPGFPDCIARGFTGEGWERVRMEFEFRSGLGSTGICPSTYPTHKRTERHVMRRHWSCLAVISWCALLLLTQPAAAQETEWERLNQEVMSLYQQGQYDRAAVVTKKALEVAEREFGSDHPRVATSLYNLARLYKTQGQYKAAEPLYKRSLAIREKVLRPEHPQVATSLNNLAGLYEAQGQYKAAEPLHKRSLAILEKALGPEHPDVAISLNNLAAVHQAQGQYEAAAPLYKRSLAIAEKALGPEHPDVASVLEDMSAMYAEMGEAERARALAARAARIRELNRQPEPPERGAEE